MNLDLTCIIIIHNAWRLAHRSIGSVLSQTILPRKLILLITSGIDEEYDFFKSYETFHNVEVVKSHRKLTCWESKSLAADLNCTKCFFTLDSDDYIAPTYIESLDQLLKTNHIVGSDYWNVGIDGFHVKNSYSDLELSKHNVMHCASIINRDAYYIAGGYENVIHEDWHLFAKLQLKGFKLYNVPIPLFYYVRSSTSFSNYLDKIKGRQQIEHLFASANLFL